jgi:hypothetical protein
MGHNSILTWQEAGSNFFFPTGAVQAKSLHPLKNDEQNAVLSWNVNFLWSWDLLAHWNAVVYSILPRFTFGLQQLTFWIELDPMP